MKLFVSLILCSLAPFILANGSDNYYNQQTACRCVNRDLCSYKFSSLIEPRSPRYQCARRTQVCCKLEHILPIANEAALYQDVSTESAYEDDSYASDYYVDPNYDGIKKPIQNSLHGKCGQRTKISAYKRLVLPAAYAALGEFPWQAAILRNYSEGFVFVSSGVLIDRDIILTTAHNVDKLKSQNVLVRLGENNVQADPRRKYHHINARVSKILIKDDFNRDTLENDFAVLCLEKRVKCNEVVAPICLPEPTDYIDENAKCVVSGWGKGSYNGNYSTVLRKANLNLVPQDKCQYLIRKRISDPTYVLDKSFTCAGGELGKDACTGDAGGPLSCTNKNGQQVLTGLVSWGISCGEKDVPGVYSNVRDANSLNWIKNVAIKECRKRNSYTNIPSNYNNLPSSSYLPNAEVNYNNVPAVPAVPAAIAAAEYNNKVPSVAYNNRPIENTPYNNVPVAPINRPIENNVYTNVPSPVVDNTPYNNKPVDQYINRPLVDNYNNRPVDQYNNNPVVDNYNNNPVVDNYNNNPVLDNYNNVPSVNYNNRPVVDQYNNRPVDNYREHI